MIHPRYDDIQKLILDLEDNGESFDELLERFDVDKVICFQVLLREGLIDPELFEDISGTRLSEESYDD